MNEKVLGFNCEKEDMELYLCIVKGYIDDVRKKICDKSWDFGVINELSVEVLYKFRKDMEDLGCELGNLEMVYGVLEVVKDVVLMDEGMMWLRRFYNKVYIEEFIVDYLDDVEGLGGCYFEELEGVSDELKEKMVKEVCNEMLRVVREDMD